MPQSRHKKTAPLHALLVGAWGKLPLPGWLRARLLWWVLPKFLVGAVAVILNGEGHVLLFKHTYRLECPWGLPSGWLQKGEKPEVAIVREILEESGYRVKVQRAVVVGGDASLQRLDLYYECMLKGGTFQPSVEVSQAVFFALDDLPDCLEPFHKQVVLYTAQHPERSITHDEKT